MGLQHPLVLFALGVGVCVFAIACMCVDVHACVCMHLYVCVCIKYVCVYVCVYVYMCMLVHACVLNPHVFVIPFCSLSSVSPQSQCECHTCAPVKGSEELHWADIT